jgi:hypothetical protein
MSTKVTLNADEVARLITTLYGEALDLELREDDHPEVYTIDETILSDAVEAAIVVTDVVLFRAEWRRMWSIKQVSDPFLRRERAAMDKPARDLLVGHSRPVQKKQHAKSPKSTARSGR